MKKIAYAPANALTSVISSHEYTYQPGGNITTWKRNNGLTDTITTYGYDAADQLLTALTAATATPSVTTETFGYSYDKAGNRQSEQRDTVMAGFTFNNLNQVLSRNGGGGILVQGNTDEPAQVTVNGKSVTPAADNTFETVVPGTKGANTIAVTAKDFSPSQNTQTKSWSATMSAGATATYTYDGNGNMTGDGSRTFQWDAKNRLTRIVYIGTNASTEMAYDGLDRRVSIVEKDGTGTVVSSKSFVWDGLSIADQRIGSTVSKQYFSEGWRDASAGTNCFYGRDHLGSVREVVNASSGVLTRYGYDAYGRGSKLSGTVESDFQYTGHYAHSPSGLYLSPYRAYEAELGRWISRDPISEAGGINLYGYVQNNPINLWDPYGLYDFMDFMYDASNFSAGVGDTLTHLPFMDRALTDIARDYIGGNDVVDKCSTGYGVGEIAGTGLGLALGGSAALRVGAEISIANRGNAVGKWLSQGRNWRLGASGAKQTPTLRIGAARPPTPYNHIDLTFFGH